MWKRKLKINSSGKLFFIEKTETTNNIILTENNQAVREDKKFVKMKSISSLDESQSFENDESCKLIKENYDGESFSFKSIYKDDIIKAIKKLPSNKASVSNNIPILIIKNFGNCYSEKLANIFNNCLKKNKFHLMKIDKISPAFINLGNNSKDNYWPISTLYQTLSKLSTASFLCNWIVTCKTNFRNISRVFGKTIIRRSLS